MQPSIPSAVARWLQSTDDSWKSCERADWFVYVACLRGRPVRDVARALARNMPPVVGPAELQVVTEPLRELLAACASGQRPSVSVEEAIRRVVRPRLLEWNIARQYHGSVVPLGIPASATPAEEPLRRSATAALRLWNVVDSGDASDEAWPALALVAQFIVFERAGCDRSPLYNHADHEASARELELHRALCDALRAELAAVAG